MAWALRSTGSQYLNLPSTINIPASTTFIIEYEFSYSADFGRPFGRTSTFNSRVLHFFSTQEVRLTDDAGNNATFTAPAHTKTDLNKFRFERDGSNNVDFYLNDVFVSAVSGFSGAFNVQLLWRHNQLSSLTTSGLMTFLSFTIGGTQTNYYSSDDSSHAAGTVTLVDTIGANNAVGVGFVEDGTDWVEFGGSIDASASLIIPKPSASVTLTNSNPSFNASGSVVVAPPLLSGQLANDNPQFNASASITIPNPISNGNAENTKPAYDLSGSIEIPAPLISGNLSNGVSVINLSGDIIITQPLFGGSLSKSNPQFNLSGSIEINKPLVSGDISSNLPVVNLSGNITIIKPTVSGSISKTKPNFTASGSVLISKPELTGALVNGTINITFNSETNYNQPYLSSNFSQSNQSTGYVQPFLSTNRTQ